MAIGPGLQAEDAIANLFQLPLEAFTGARNTLTAKLKKQGLAEDAARVKSLPKPPVPAWAINQLHWRHRPTMDRLIAAGDRFRNAQTARFPRGGPDLWASFEARRDALTTAVATTTEVLRANGHTPTPGLLRRVTTTLEALATLGTTAFAPPRGRLIAGLVPQRFESLAALIPRGASTNPKTITSQLIPFTPKSDRRTTGNPPPATATAKRSHLERLAAAKALREVERKIAKARSAQQQAEKAMKAAAAQSKVTARTRAAVERIKATVDRRHAVASRKASAALELAQTRARAAEEADEVVQHAERGLRAAQARAE